MGNPLLKDVDKKYNLIGMHDIKVGVHKSKTNPEEVLSEDQLKQFKKLTFWKQKYPKEIIRGRTNKNMGIV